jgi:hypothetical protein
MKYCIKRSCITYYEFIIRHDTTSVRWSILLSSSFRRGTKGSQETQNRLAFEEGNDDDVIMDCRPSGDGNKNAFVPPVVLAGERMSLAKDTKNSTGNPVLRCYRRLRIGIFKPLTLLSSRD